jgi:HAMP domain-containing protein
MIKKLKLKILAGFMLLAFMLLVAGILSVSEFSRLSSSVNSLIEDNYKTIEAAKSMLEALDREDNGILLLLLGQWDGGRTAINSADSSFMAALMIARGNQTEVDEDKYVDAVSTNYGSFKEIWEKPLVNTDKEGSINWYKNDIHKAFLETKYAVENLMNLNQQSMYAEASQLKEKSKRAIMPGIVAIISAFIFLILFNFFISKYFISPLHKLSEAVKSVQPYDKRLISTVKSNDELKILEHEINNLLERLTRSSE